MFSWSSRTCPMGIDHRVRKQVNDLLASGWRVSVVTRRDPANARYHDLPEMTVLEYPAPREPRGKIGYIGEYGASFCWATVFSLAVRLHGRVDVVQFCQPPDIYFPLAWVLRGLGAKVVAEQRDLMPELFAARYDHARPEIMSVLRWLERRTQRAVHHTLCTNETSRRRLIGAGAAPERVTIVGNGPVLSRVQAATADRALRGQHKFLCCWIGMMGRQDRVDLLLRAVAHLVHDLGRTDCGFAVLGDGECLEEARALSTRLGLQSWVDFPGWLPEAQVFSYLASADLGLDTSLQSEISRSRSSSTWPSACRSSRSTWRRPGSWEGARRRSSRRPTLRATRGRSSRCSMTLSAAPRWARSVASGCGPTWPGSGSRPHTSTSCGGSASRPRPQPA